MWKDTVLRAGRGDRGHPARRVEPGAVDGALPHRRAHRERHDVQLRRGPPAGAGAMTPRRPPRDVLVIGGGQAGLAMGHELARRGQRFEIVDAGAEVGGAWRSRWDSLRLFTAARFDSLPGLPFPAHRDSLSGQGRRRGLPAAVRRHVRAAGAAEHAGDGVDPLRRRVRREGRRPGVRGPTRGRGHRPVPPTVGAAGRRPPRPRGAPAPQHRLPAARCTAARQDAGGRRGQHGLPDRRGARRDPRRGPVGRLTPADHPAAAAGPRHLVVGHPAAAGPRHRRLPARQAAGRTGPEHRRRPATARPPRRPAARSRRRRRRARR